MKSFRSLERAETGDDEDDDDDDNEDDDDVTTASAALSGSNSVRHPPGA